MSRLIRQNRAAKWLLRGPLGIRDICYIITEYGNALEGERADTYETDIPVAFLVELRGIVAAGSNADSTIRLYAGNRLLGALSCNAHKVTRAIGLRDGRLVASYSDNVIRVWSGVREILEARGDVVPLELVGHTNSVYALAEFPDGRLISGSCDKSIRLWDTYTGACTIIAEDLDYWPASLEVIPGLSEDLPVRVAYGSWDHCVRILDLTGKCVSTLVGHSDFVSCIRMLPDGRLVSGSADTTICVWDINTGAFQLALSGHGGMLSEIVLLPDGKIAAAADSNAICVWCIDKDQPEKVGLCMVLECPEEISMRALTVLPDGSLAAGSSDKKIRKWE